MWRNTRRGRGVTSPPNRLCRKTQQNMCIINFCWALKGHEKGTWDKSWTETNVQHRRDPDSAEPGRVSLWSIHGWTLWHLIRRADETSPCLNWSGFVSAPLSHDPLLYGSVEGGGNPLEYTALVGLLFACDRPTERMLDWSYFMLGLTLSSTLLHRISYFPLLLPLFFFLLNPTTAARFHHS